MYNSVKAFLFSLLIAATAFYFSRNVVMYKKLINKSLGKLGSYQINLEYVEQEWEEDQREDISSKLNINFVDFTMFKEARLAVLFKPEYS